MRSAWNNVFRAIVCAGLAAAGIAYSAPSAETTAIYFLDPDSVPEEGSLLSGQVTVVNFSRFAKALGFSGKPRDPRTRPRRQSRNLRSYVRNLAKAELEDLVRSPNFQAYADSGDSGLAELARIESKELIEDIRSSRYLLSRKCVDSLGVERDAVAGMGDRNGEICIDIERMLASALRSRKGEYDEGSVRESMLALLLHEHAHHFGVLDSDGKLFRSLLAVFHRLSTIGAGGIRKVAYVSPEFARLRREYREAITSEIDTASAGEYRCSVVTREAASLEFPETAAFLGYWFAHGRLASDAVDEARFRFQGVSGSSGSALNLKKIWIGYDLLVTDPALSVPISNDGKGMFLNVGVAFRRSERDRLLFEVFRENPKGYLPAVTTEPLPQDAGIRRLSSLAFGECSR